MTVICLADRVLTSWDSNKTPSQEVRRETQALLAAVQSKPLPRSLAETDGVILTQKNTFFHVQPRDSNDSWADDIPSDCESGSLESENSLNASRLYTGIRLTRKKTEGNIIVPSLRRMSTSLRCRSCPPTAPTSPTDASRLEDASRSTSPSNVEQVFTPYQPITASISASSAPTLYTFAPADEYRPPTLPLMCLLESSLPEALLSPVVESKVSSVLVGGVKSSGTTVMLRNVPYHEGQVGVLRLLESRGFLGKFDFFYAPLDFSSGNNLGYAFINFRSVKAVADFVADIEGLRVTQFDGWQAKELRVCWARVQGLTANVEHYRNSPVNEMPVQFRPMLFDHEGGQVSFPRPDRINGDEQRVNNGSPSKQRISPPGRRLSVPFRNNSRPITFPGKPRSNSFRPQ